MTQAQTCWNQLGKTTDYSPIIELFRETYANLTKALTIVNLIPVVNDEVERFTDDNKNYPFNKREKRLPS